MKQFHSLCAIETNAQPNFTWLVAIFRIFRNWLWWNWKFHQPLSIFNLNNVTICSDNIDCISGDLFQKPSYQFAHKWIQSPILHRIKTIGRSASCCQWLHKMMMFWVGIRPIVSTIFSPIPNGPTKKTSEIVQSFFSVETCVSSFDGNIIEMFDILASDDRTMNFHGNWKMKILATPRWIYS